MKPKCGSLLTAGWLMLAVSGFLTTTKGTARAADSDYVVVVSVATLSNPAWKAVVDALVEKHGGSVQTYERIVTETRDELRRRFPRYACFVARPEEVSREFVAQVHRLTRELDDDPYVDLFWGILTGYDAGNALRIARYREPLTVRKAVAGTEIALNMCEEGRWYSELEKNRWVKKDKGEPPREQRGPDDTTEALVKALTQYRPDLLVTSGHATEHDWMIGFAYRNGFFRCQDGALYGIDAGNHRYPIQSPNPKVFLPVGNCLMGHIDDRDAMALAYMNSAGVCQMAGYTMPTWYGYMGWGILDYFLEQPGRFTLTEAFFANHHALTHRLATCFPELLNAKTDESGRTAARIELSAGARKLGLSATDGRGLLFDRDVVAFYGDPAWEARMAPQECAWDQSLVENGGFFVFTIEPKRGAKSFEPANTNGSQRGWRPMIHYLPFRIGKAEILKGADLDPVVTDNFILLPNPRKWDSGRVYRIEFRAERID
jgi:hypothetical protein